MFSKEKLFEELNNVFGDSERSCTPDDATKLKYLEVCIKETLRLYQPPFNSRTITEEVKVGM